MIKSKHSMPASIIEIMLTKCTHTDKMNPDVKPSGNVCVEGSKTGEVWVSLRVCQTCGHVGCCDSSPGKHARAHFEETGHPIIKDQENTWAWCYIDDDYVELA